MSEINEAMESVKIGLSLFSEAIGLVKKTNDILPESDNKESVEKSLNEASKAVRIAEAQIPKAFRYNHCK